MALLGKAEGFRARKFAQRLGPFLEGERSVLDVGCGTGVVSSLLAKEFNLEIQGIDIQEPKKASIAFKLFDGKKIPFPANSFDTVFLLDVLHHVGKKPLQQQLLQECFRVAKKSVIVKDHYYSNFLQKQYLKLIDLTARLFHGFATPFSFSTKRDWEKKPAARIEFWTDWGIPNVMVKYKK